MAKPIAVTPTYASGDLARILEFEQRQVEETVADLSDEHLTWRQAPTARSALDILWHLAYNTEPAYPPNKAEALSLPTNQGVLDHTNLRWRSCHASSLNEGT